MTISRSTHLLHFAQVPLPLKERERFEILGKGTVSKMFRLDGRDVKLTFKNGIALTFACCKPHVH